MLVSIDRYEVTNKLCIDHRAREWCKKPYPNHKKGCPNYGKKPECPPQAPLIEEWLDLEKNHWFIVTTFDLRVHSNKMKEKHPNWSDKQARCVLYWQGSVKKDLRTACDIFTSSHPDELVYTLLPEAMGVHVLRTARLLGLPIRARPRNLVYKIALVGYPKKNGSERKTLLDYLT